MCMLILSYIIHIWHMKSIACGRERISYSIYARLLNFFAHCFYIWSLYRKKFDFDIYANSAVPNLRQLVLWSGASLADGLSLTLCDTSHIWYEFLMICWLVNEKLSDRIEDCTSLRSVAPAYLELHFPHMSEGFFAWHFTTQTVLLLILIYTVGDLTYFFTSWENSPCAICGQCSYISACAVWSENYTVRCCQSMKPCSID